jgi:phage terminase large subunit
LSILQIPTARVFLPLLAPARDKVARGGRGSGKSHFFGGLMVEDALAEPGNSAGEGLRAVCIREVQKDLAQSAKLLIEGKIAGMGLREADGFKCFEDCTQTPGDGLIIYKGMNNYTADSIKSLEGFKRSWWEEAHTATARSINLLRPTMRASGSQLWWSYNRSRKTDPVDVMFTGDELPTGAAVVDANWSDNPWFPAELQQERLDCLRMQPEQYEHIWNGDYVTVAEGAYFAKHLADAKAQGRIGNVAADPNLAKRVYCDLGGSGAKADAFVMWVCQFVAREIRVLDYYETDGQPAAEHFAWLRKRGYDAAKVFLPHDGLTESGANPGSWQSAFRNAGWDVTTLRGEGSGNAGARSARIEAVRRVFPQIWFNGATTKPGRDALGWYHEKKDEARGVGLGPEHDWASHGADAFGLMAVAYEAPAKAQKLDMSNLTRGMV